MHNLCRMADMHHGVLNLIGWDTRREAPTASAETLLENMCVQILSVVIFHVGHGQIRAKVCTTCAKVGLFV
jgi:hypothetical protein